MAVISADLVAIRPALSGVATATLDAILADALIEFKLMLEMRGIEYDELPDTIWLQTDLDYALKYLALHRTLGVVPLTESITVDNLSKKNYLGRGFGFDASEWGRIYLRFIKSKLGDGGSIPLERAS